MAWCTRAQDMHQHRRVGDNSDKGGNGPRSASSTEARKWVPLIPARSRGSAPRGISGRLISATGLPQGRQDAMKEDGRGLGDREPARRQASLVFRLV